MKTLPHWAPPLPLSWFITGSAFIRPFSAESQQTIPSVVDLSPLLINLKRAAKISNSRASNLKKLDSHLKKESNQVAYNGLKCPVSRSIPAQPLSKLTANNPRLPINFSSEHPSQAKANQATRLRIPCAKTKRFTFRRYNGSSLPTMFGALITRWDNLPLRWKGIVLAALPFIVLLISASVSWWGNTERERTERALAHHIALTNSLEDEQFLIVNAETGMRGFLLTRKSEFLDPFRRAQRELPKQQKVLAGLVASEPGEEVRRFKTASLNRINALIKSEMDALLLLQSKTKASQTTLLPLLQSSKSDMDKLRSELRLMRGAEERLMGQRLQDIARVRRRDYIGVFLTLLVGIIARAVWIYLFNTGINARLKKVKDNIQAQNRGEELPHPASQTADALGELEREIISSYSQLKTSPFSPNTP